MPDGTLSDIRETSLTIICEPCGRRGRYAVARLIEKYGADAKLPDLRQTLADCQKTRTANIYDRCKAIFEKPPTEAPVTKDPPHRLLDV
jgi:hypothetical protein